MASTVAALRATLLWLVVAAIASASRYPSWSEWKAAHNKRYDSEREEHERQAVWLENLKIVKAANSARQKAFIMEMNHLADRRSSEMASFAALHEKPSDADVLSQSASDEFYGDIPASFSWASQGVVTPVKNQGTLGDVASYVIAECVESFHAIQTGSLLTLSAEEVHDCCSFPNATFDCIHQIGGLCTDSAYPHSGGNMCKNSSCTAAAKVNGGVKVQAGNETALVLAVLKTPVAVGIDASHTSFQLYKSGVYSDPKCGTQIDHMLQLIGYGVLSDGTAYWICRNSWGTSWGMNGYIWIARNKRNMCGIASYASYPV